MTAVATNPDRLTDRLVSDGFGPIPVLVACCLAGTRDGSTAGASIGWGVLALAFLAVLPYVATYRVRHSRSGAPEGRLKAAYTVGVAAIAALGFGLLAALGAPRSLLAVAIAIVVTLVASAVVTGAWHWSNHAAAGGAGIAMSVILGGPWWLLLAPMLLAVGATRVRLGRHSWPQVVLGAVMGVVVSSAVLLPLLR